MFGVSGDHQWAVCVLQGDLGEGVPGGDDGHGEHPGHDGGDLQVVAQWVEVRDACRLGAFGGDHVGQDAQRAGELVEGVGAGGVRGLNLYDVGKVGGFDAVPAAVVGRGQSGLADVCGDLPVRDSEVAGGLPGVVGRCWVRRCQRARIAVQDPGERGVGDDLLTGVDTFRAG